MPSYTAELDRDTPRHTGAGARFQVLWLIDDETGKDAMHLIHQGTHYNSKESLESDIAEAFGVSPPNVQVHHEKSESCKVTPHRRSIGSRSVLYR